MYLDLTIHEHIYCAVILGMIMITIILTLTAGIDDDDT